MYNKYNMLEIFEMGLLVCFCSMSFAVCSLPHLGLETLIKSDAPIDPVMYAAIQNM